MQGEICTDNRFEIIEAAKKRLLEATNIHTRPDEVAVLDSLLYRMWQMGWLPGCEKREKHGRWIVTVPGDGEPYCSECHTMGSPQWKRCPVCEAKMDKERSK